MNFPVRRPIERVSLDRYARWARRSDPTSFAKRGVTFLNRAGRTGRHSSRARDRLDRPRCRAAAGRGMTATSPSSAPRVACTKSVRRRVPVASLAPPSDPGAPHACAHACSLTSRFSPVPCRVRVQGDQVRGDHVHRRPGQGQRVRGDAEEDSGTYARVASPRPRSARATLGGSDVFAPRQSRDASTPAHLPRAPFRRTNSSTPRT